MRRIYFQLFCLALLILLAACTPVAPPSTLPATATTAPASAEDAGAFPVTITSCGMETTYQAPPARAVAMNQGATEIMLALGLQASMVGTAYLDNAILPAYQDAYDAIPVLAVVYPAQEVLLAAEPDFVYGAYASAFADEAAGSRDDLAALGINSYLSNTACDDRSLRLATTTFETVFAEIKDIGRIFGIEERANALIADLQSQLDDVHATIGDDSKPPTIFWYDSGADEPFVGSCCGAPNMIMAAVGATNIFSDAAGNWAAVNWETILERNPQVIVVIDADWDPAQDKIDLLQSDPTYATIAAVQNQRFIVLPFSATTLGVRNVAAVVDLARALYPEKFE